MKINSYLKTGIPLFCLYLIVRLFSQYEYFPLAEDQCAYLSLARNLPEYILYNNDFYLIHPPLYPAAIAAMACIMPLFHAGLAVSILFGILNYFLLLRMARVFSLGRIGTLIALLYFVLNATSISMETHVSRMNMLLFLTGMAICSFQEYLQTREKRHLVMTCIFNVLSVSCSDQGILLLGAQGVQFIVHGEFARDWKVFLKIMLLSLLFFSIWPIVRLCFYLSNPDYPAGIDGTVEYFTRITLMDVLQPNNLPITKYHRSFFTSTTFSIANISFQNIVILFAGIVFLPKWICISMVSIFSIGAMAMGIVRKDKHILALLAISLVFLVPSMAGMYYWYSYPAVIPFALLIGRGVHLLAERFRIREKWLVIAEVSIAVILSLMWLSGFREAKSNTVFSASGGTHFLFSRIPVTKGQAVFRNLPEENAGFMAPIGLVSDAIYLSGRRFLALPYDCDKLDYLLAKYDVKYICFPGECLNGFSDGNMNFVTSRDIIGRIVSTPSKFEKAAEWKESYPDCYPAETFYLYRVNAGPDTGLKQ
ncbi:MAG TPA: hypothetical protein DET40_22880 [Lentisphaeria bacterium]|nr:MAG: hypothetical protein A2X45_15905 [Lentisphaerae bacterium GWF2_50_93]HCE46399.1 hypothetical protein [Lentisphaeria bacterium]